MLMKMARSYDIICLQECHGHKGDLERLASEILSHWLKGSFYRRPGVGGTIIGVRRSKLHQPPEHKELDLGRFHYVDLHIAGGRLRIVNVHIDPAKTHEGKTQIMQKLASLSKPSLGYGCMVMGDYNFQALGGGQILHEIIHIREARLRSACLFCSSLSSSC